MDCVSQIIRSLFYKVSDINFNKSIFKRNKRRLFKIHISTYWMGFVCNICLLVNNTKLLKKIKYRYPAYTPLNLEYSPIDSANMHNNF